MVMPWLAVGSLLHRPAMRLGGPLVACTSSIPEIALPNGFLLVDKPENWTSFDVVGKVRYTLERHFKAQGHRFGRRSRLKVGHGGTLDPLATGALAIGVGAATKQLDSLLAGPKSYVATARLGFETDTQDSTGEILGTPCTYGHVTRAGLEEALSPFRGEIMQRPPIYSALRKDGKRMYELARAGLIQENDMEPRPVTIHSIELVSFDEGSFTLRVRCSGGTYIRALIVDIARAVTSAAHMTALRRTTHGPFDLDLGRELGGVEPVCVDAFADAPQLLEAIDDANQLIARL